jgi:hypothetical protein
MNFTCISAFDASKDIIWSFSYKFEGNGNILGSCGFTTFLNFLSSQTGGGIDSGLGYGPYTGYSNVSGNFLAIAFENSGTFALQGNGFTTGITAPIYNSVILRYGTDFQYLTAKVVDFNIVSDEWTTLRFQLTNLGNTLNVFHCDNNFNYNKILTVKTSDIFLLSQQMYIGMSYATPINGSTDFKLRVKNFHYYAQNPTVLPPVIKSQALSANLISSTIPLSAEVVGAQPLYYEWYRNDALIPDANESVYNAFVTGTYKFITSNIAGSVSSQEIIVY